MLYDSCVRVGKCPWAFGHPRIGRPVGDTRVGHVPVGLLIHIETCIGQAMDMKDHDDDDRELGESIHEACTNMMTKWNKYFSTADHLNVVAHIIDPRFKLRL